MRPFFLLVFVLFSGVASAQWEYTDSIRKANNRTLGRELFTRKEGWLLGPAIGHEMNNLALGGEVKYFVGWHFGQLPWSAYSGARYLFTSPPQLPDAVISIGANASIIGLENNFYLGGDDFLWYLTPKIGFDGGRISVFYGYGIPLIGNDPGRSYRHSFTVKFAVNLSAFGEHRTRRNYWEKYGPRGY